MNPLDAIFSPRRRQLPAVGVLGGVLLGSVARFWMRLLTDDPEFSWAGTVLIVLAFAVFGLGQAAALAARLSRWRRRTVVAARCCAGVSSFMIFTGAGAMMMPTVVLGALALWRRRWPTALRVVLAVMAAAVPVFLLTQGGEVALLRRLTGFALFLATYGLVIVAFGATVAADTRVTRSQPEPMEVLT